MRLILAMIFSFTGFLGSHLVAQETLVDDLPPPFEGTIAYQVRYEGPNSKKWAAYLPDSVEIMAHGGNLHVRVFGGASDSLVHEYLWLAEADMCYALDRRSKIAWASPDDFKASQRESKMVDEDQDSLLGRACKRYELAGGKESYLVSEGIRFPVREWDSTTTSRPPFLAGGLQTIPLRIKQEAALTSISEAVAIRGESAPIGLPEGFEVKPFFAREIRHPFIGKD